ncbi:TVP38/TMEM64 family protein [Azospirillum sp. SYSU D00513]|uniref:TVP38/TMEM64 family protein n=1 Tax=Azospirillum sp. SYSU D00513 TaxID=2812561 RepID=UPI001A95EAEF|nr:TVP38/TMEM64 family protein [Azospirillum sp. SYSU D00513]
MQPSLSSLRAAGQILIILALAGGAAAWVLRGGFDVGQLQEILRHHRAAPLLFLLFHIATSLMFLPRSAMAMMAGLIFGVWWGGALAVAGSVLGAVTGFLVARHVNRGMLSLGETARFARLVRRIEHGGWRAVATLRLVPVLPHSAVNYALGLTRIRLVPYTVGTLIGQLPMTVAFVQFGAASDHLLDGKPDWMLPTALGVATLVLSSLLPKLLPRLGESGEDGGTR